MSADKNRLLLVPASQVGPSRSFKFSFSLNGEKTEGFVLNEKGNYYAYLNKCRHRGVTLDWDTNDFYTPEKDFLICKTHGAVYQPETGYCVEGPCAGKSLFPLPVVLESGQVFLDMKEVERLYGK